MTSIIQEIYKLRSNAPLNIDRSNSNRYRIVTQEADGSKTAYCFSAPLYNHQIRQLVDLNWKPYNEGYIYTGSQAYVKLFDQLEIADETGRCFFSLPTSFSARGFDKYNNAKTVVSPTLNGVVCTNRLLENGKCTHVIKTQKFDLQIRSNDKYFALMHSKFKPFIVISCIGTIDNQGQIIAPADIHYQQLSYDTFEICITPKSPFGTGVMYEINLHENKLLQDTTVESDSPAVNNAFGSIAFIGDTAAYGQQWLYTRPNLSMVPDLAQKQINRIIFHNKVWNGCPAPLAAIEVTSRFCSFGSNWSNKVSGGNTVAYSTSTADYLSFDITEALVNTRTRFLKPSNGFILKAQNKSSGFAVLSTGDSSIAPQILEINY